MGSTVSKKTRVQSTISYRMLLLMLSAVLIQCEAQYFVNICEESSGHKCCAETGMKDHTYWIMGDLPSTWERLDMQCNIEGGKLLVLESRRENDCIVKYILDEYKGEPVKSFAIGLKTPQNYKGVYEWRRVDNGKNPDAATPTFENWAPAAPTGKYCVVMNIGTAAPISGLWKDVDCGSAVYGICEKDK